MVLYLSMDQKTWAQGDFTDSATYDLSGKVYDENTLTTARNISGFTGTLRLINQEGTSVFTTTDNLTLGADGSILIKFASGAVPTLQGIFKVRLRLEISGTRLTCVGVNGSDEVYFEHD